MTATPPSPLEQLIRDQIAIDGPMSIGDYMNICLTHPDHGYYTTGHPVGGRASAARSGGDFITAPEVSQMFGEMIGIWCMEVWQALGSPPRFTLAEIGPGRGTLMRDLLRISAALPGFAQAMDLHLVEISPTLSEQQSLTLSDTGQKVTWLRDIADLPAQPTIVIGNELLDALPFRQWIKSGNQWVERAVGLQDDTLCFTTRPALLPATDLPENASQQPDGAIFETSSPREAFIAQLADMLIAHSGAALMIDYGHLKSGFGDTFQAMRDHAYVSPLDAPGTADLTSHVDFEPLTKIAAQKGCAVPPPTTQGAFLLALGLLERAGNLGQNRAGNVQDSLRAAVERLAGNTQMGQLFKAIAFGAPKSLGERWPGFG